MWHFCEPWLSNAQFRCRIDFHGLTSGRISICMENSFSVPCAEIMSTYMIQQKWKNLCVIKQKGVCVNCASLKGPPPSICWSWHWGICHKTSAMVRTTSDKEFSRTFQGQLTVFKDYDFFNKSAFLNPLLNTYYWLFTLTVSNGVIYIIIF